MSLTSTVASWLPDAAFTRMISVAHRSFEPELSRVARAYPRGGTFIDVGTWYGPWTAWISKRATRVISFEPNPSVAAVLERTVRANVEVRRAAVSDRAGVAVLSLPPPGRGGEGKASLEGDVGGTDTVEVPTVRLDDLDVSDVRLVKIDVEGHELAALHGAGQLLETHHPVLVVELEERHGGIAPSVDFLADLGYSAQVLVGGHWIALDDFDLAAHQLDHEQTAAKGYLAMALRRSSHYVNNVVFTHPRSTWRVG